MDEPVDVKVVGGGLAGMVATMATQPHQVSRRGVLKIAGLSTAAAVAAACASAAPPTTSPTPSTAAAGGKQEWEVEWDKLVATARQEGKLSIITIAGTGYRKWMAAFEEALPGITVEHQQVPQVQAYVSRLLEERKAGVYVVDVLLTGALVMPALKPGGALDPLRPALMRPDVLGNNNWRDGFDAGWVDLEKKLAYNGAEDVRSAHINTDLVKTGEIKDVRDLLEPGWKGKIFLIDPRVSGFSAGPLTSIRLKLGNDVLKRLLVDQEPAFHRDNRLITEALIRGQYAIATGVTKPVLDQFLEQGVGKNVSFLDIPGFSTVGSGDGLWLVNRAPHPGAAKLFVNWALSKAGQEAYSKAIGGNSRRADIPPVDLERLPKPGQNYFGTNEGSIAEVEKTREFIEPFLKA